MRFLSWVQPFVCALAVLGLASHSAIAQSHSDSVDSRSLATRPAIANPLLNAYQDTLGRFEIALPANYSVVPTPTGVVFSSEDGGFGGLVDVGSAQGRWFSLDELEAALKTEYEQRLTTVTWQGSYVHVQGGVRIDWVGEDPAGNHLDAISFIQQHGNAIFVLSLWGVNTPYSTYNDAADAIFSTYRIQP